MGRMALDGTLWVEDGIPYMIYCHEWVQIADGSMELVRLTDDLSAPVGNSLTLFPYIVLGACGAIHKISAGFRVGQDVGIADVDVGDVLYLWLGLCELYEERQCQKNPYEGVVSCFHFVHVIHGDILDIL